METGPWPHLDRRQERGVVWGGRHRFLLEVPANFGERRKAEVRRNHLLRTPVNKRSAAVRESTVCHHWLVGKIRARREESMTSSNIIRLGGIAAMVGGGVLGGMEPSRPGELRSRRQFLRTR